MTELLNKYFIINKCFTFVLKERVYPVRGNRLRVTFPSQVMPYDLRDRAGTDGFKIPSAKSSGPGPDVMSGVRGPIGEGLVEVRSQQVEQLLDMLDRLAGPAHVHNRLPNRIFVVN